MNVQSVNNFTSKNSIVNYSNNNSISFSGMTAKKWNRLGVKIIKDFSKIEKMENKPEYSMKTLVVWQNRMRKHFYEIFSVLKKRKGEEPLSPIKDEALMVSNFMYKKLANFTKSSPKKIVRLDDELEKSGTNLYFSPKFCLANAKALNITDNFALKYLELTESKQVNYNFLNHKKWENI